MAETRPQNDRDRFHWLALAMTPGVGPVRFKQLLRVFSTPKDVFGASAERLRHAANLPEITIKALTRFDWGHTVEQELTKVERQGLKLLTWADPDYPPRLREIPDPPVVLWTSGDFVSRDEAAVAIVGARSASEYGRRTAYRLAGELAEAGVTVVSGAALGIDAAAHRGALETGGRTVGVLGCGLDVIYPSSNRDLYSKIPLSGVLVSEFPLGTEPMRSHFPRRNRIISGLSVAVVVVEAGEKSGAMITARQALDQNRDVLAVPGQADSARHRGNHSLLKQGARLVESGRDILEEIAPQLSGGLPQRAGTERRLSTGRAPAGKAKKQDCPGLFGPGPEGPEKNIWDLLDGEPVHIDHILRRTGMSPSGLAPILLEMELKGLIRLLPGTRYTRT